MLSQAIQQVLFTRPLEKEVPDIVKKYGGSLYVPAPTSTPIRNLLTYSQAFNDASWVKINAAPGVAPVVTSDYGEAPDGTMTADRIQFDSSGGGNSMVSKQSLTLVANTTYTLSVWMKSLTSDTAVTMYCGDATTTVTVTTSWQRFVYTRTVISGTEVRFAKRDTWGTAGVGDILFWGAQLELGSTATAYQAIAAAGTPIKVDLPGSCFQDSAGTTPCTVDSPVGLMLDTANPVRNRNLFKNTGFVGGVAGSPGTAPTSVPIANAPTGVTRTLAYGITADGKAYIDVTYSGTNTSGATQYPSVRSDTTTNPAISGQTFTLSAELALISGSWPTSANIQIGELNSSLGFLVGGTTSIKTTVTTSTLTKVSHTRTLINASTAYVSAYLVTFTINNNEAVNFTVRIANPQLELSSTATNFVPNTYMGYSVNQIEGNHATQGTAGFKPILRGEIKNLLLNSATLSTQNITSVAAPYTLHFTGTGTVTLSGTSTAGPLVGTGASDRVSLTFTPTAGTLTLTVSGSVTTAQLELGSTANPYIPTTSAAASSSYGPYWLDFDGTDDRLQLGSVPFQMSSNQTVIVSGQPLAASKPMFALAAGSTSESLPYLGTNASSYLGYEASGGGTTVTAFDTVSSLGINSVLSAVKTTDAIYVYKNSKAMASGTTSGTYTTATNAMLGGSGRTTVVSYRGSINCAAILPQAASQTDMRKIEKYAAKLSGAQL